jgi:hypothetical protein
MPGVQTMSISGFQADTWGDEGNYLKRGDTELKWNLTTAPPSVGVSGFECSRYDWYSREGIEQSTLLAVAQVRATGDVGSQTVTITPGSDLIVRQIVVPEFEGAGNSIYITNDAGTTQSYALSAVANKHSYTESDNGSEKTYSYWVIDVSKLDHVKNGKILSIKYEIGTMHQGDRTLLYDSSDFPDQYFATRLALYGSDSTTANQSTTFTVTDTTATSSYIPQTAISSFNNSREKKVLLDARNYTMSDTSLIAGQSATVSFDIQANTYAYLLGQTTCWDEDMALFAVVPSGFEISDVTVNNTTVTPEDVTNDSSVVGNPPTDGTKIYRYNLPGSKVGYYNDDGTVAGPLHVSYKIRTSAVMNSATYNLKDFVFVGNGVSADGTTHTLSSYPINHGTSVAATNTYQINNTSNPLGSFSKEFTVQENKTLQVKNSMIITSNGTPLDEWLVYDAGNGAGRAEVKDGYTARYKVSITNDLGSDVAGARIFVPIPKEGQDFGAAFNPEGAQQFDMSFVLDPSTQIPANWTVKYLKMNSGVSYALEHAPSESDYVVVDNPSDADMILIECSGSFEADESHDFVFDVTSADLTDADGETNTWNAVVTYELGTSTLVPPARYPESVQVEKKYGTLAGVVYEDANNNGVQDSGEEGISGVTVTAVLTHTSGGTTTQYAHSATTAADGSYTISFASADDSSVSSQQAFTMLLLSAASPNVLGATSSNDSYSILVTVTNPDATTYEFSPVTTSGNNPSIVTPSSDQAQASVTLSGLSAGFSADADAGLHPVGSAKPANTVTNKATPRTGDALTGTAGQVEAMLAGGMALVALAFALRKVGQRQ